MTRRLFAAALGFTLVLFAGGAGVATALTPPPPPSGIVYSFGDRLVRIAADGSGMRELTRTGPFDQGDSLGRTGDSGVQISPDGSRMIFTRSIPSKEFNGVGTRIMLANIDGSDAKQILGGSRKVGYSKPTWMPDGNNVAVVRRIERRHSTARSVVIANLEGKVTETAFKLPLHRHGNISKYIQTFRVPTHIEVSPDGGKLLITVSNGYEYDNDRLLLVDRETGKSRLVGKKARHGSFSPDATRFTYVSSAGNKGKTCTTTHEGACVVQGDLYIQNVDGSDVQRLTRSRASEENPSWSPDGRRVAFDANYNLPRFGAAAEIYSIAPDGSCLSLLTNGATAGVEPDWTGDAGRSDLRCGAEPRELTMTGEWVPRDPKAASISVWAGPTMGNRLVSSARLVGPVRTASYEDCVVFDVAACAAEPEFEIGGFSTCLAEDFIPAVVNAVPKSAFGKRRGVTFIRGKLRIKDEGVRRSVTVFTGDSFLEITGVQGSTFAQLESQIDQLRAANVTTAEGKLPPLHLSSDFLKQVTVTDKTYRRLGLKRTAKRLKMRPKRVRSLVAFKGRIGKLGPIKTKTCTRKDLGFLIGF